MQRKERTPGDQRKRPVQLCDVSDVFRTARTAPAPFPRPRTDGTPATGPALTDPNTDDQSTAVHVAVFTRGNTYSGAGGVGPIMGLASEPCPLHICIERWVFPPSQLWLPNALESWLP